MRIFLRESRPLFSSLECPKITDGTSHTLKWRDLFSLTRQVHTPAFDDHLFNLFDGLLDVRVLPSGESLVPLPELHAVSFHNTLFHYPGGNMGQEFIDDMLTWITLRREHGIPLETFEPRNCQYAEKKGIQELRRIVPNVLCGDEWAQ